MLSDSPMGSGPCYLYCKRDLPGPIIPSGVSNGKIEVESGLKTGVNNKWIAPSFNVIALIRNGSAYNQNADTDIFFSILKLSCFSPTPNT